MSRRKHGTGFVWVVVAAALLAAPGFAPAAVQPADQTRYEIPLREFDLFNYSSPAVAQAKAQAADAFTSIYGGRWSVYSWNPQTSTPSYLYGSGVQVASAITSAQEAVNAARSVMQRSGPVLKADLANLRFEVAPHAAGKWAVHFQQTYHMLDVWGGRIHFTFTEQGRLFAMSSKIYPGITVDPTPSLTASAAEGLARADLPFNPSTDSVEGGTRLLVLPVSLSPTQVEYHLVWRVRVHTQDPVGVWVTHVDAHNGQILWRFNDDDFVNFVGTTQGGVERLSYCNGQHPEALPYLRVNVSGVGSTYADASGNWSLAYSGNDPHTVTSDLYSPYVDVNNSSGAQGAFTGTATPGTPLQVNFTDLNSQRDEKDVYQAVNDIHNFYELFVPGFSYTNQRITANVSINSTCNAYWDGTINFYQAGGGCANTGQILDVVYHEFGHGIQATLVGQQGDQGLGEGNADTNANFMTMISTIGIGFYLNNCTSGIRDSNNHLMYPQDVIGQEIHYAGQVIAGFTWDGTQALEQTYGTQPGRLLGALTWHNARLLERPLTQPDQVLATFIADDDNGNLSDGTPHYDQWCLAATNHGFTCPQILHGVMFTHTPLSTRTQEGNVAVVALVSSTEGALVADSTRVRYRVNGGAFQWLTMTPTGNPNEYQAVIPNLTHPSEVDYYLRARDVLGNTANDPPLAPTSLFSFDVANVFDTIETVPNGWVVNLEGTDNATTGIWIQADPVGTSAQPEDDHTPDPGHICWVTGNANPGDGDGTNDVDNGTTTLYSSVYDLSGASVAKVKYWRWYSNDKGGAPGEDTWAVQVRNNGGPWVDVERTLQSSDAWVLITSDLYAKFGNNIGNVQFKFIASDLINPSLVEAAVDDFELLWANGSAGVQDGVAAPARFALLGSRPNPTTAGASIEFETGVAGTVRLNVFDVSGRLVRTLADGSFPAGVHRVAWDGSDMHGRAVASGVYYCRMQAGSFTASRTVVLNR